MNLKESVAVVLEGFTSQTVLNWLDKGVIPMNAQKAIAFDTRGKLKPDQVTK